MRKIVETETGVYQPLSLKAAIIFLLLGVLLIAALALTSKMSLTAHSLQLLALVAVSLVPIFFERWKYGYLGHPVIALQDDQLIIALPNDSRRRLTIPLTTIQEIIIYGPEGHRYYRFVYIDARFVDVAPMWQKKLDDVVQRFFQRPLPWSITVTVKEPQSFFSYVRGDGP